MLMIGGHSPLLSLPQMLRVVVVATVLHAATGFARVPQNQHESLESRTGATVECGEKVSKRCVAQKVDAMGVLLNRFMIEGPQYDKMDSIETRVSDLQTQVQQILRAVGSSVSGEEPCTAEAQAHLADACDFESGDLFDGTACVRRDAIRLHSSNVPM